MIRGVFFVRNERDILKRLLPRFDVSSYDWILDEVDNSFDPGRLQGRFSGDEFRNLVENIEDYNFVRIRRYPMEAPVSDVRNYDEFLNSDCTLAVLCTDGGFYEIYLKDEGNALWLQKFCAKFAMDIELIRDDDAGGRYSFHF